MRAILISSLLFLLTTAAIAQPQEGGPGMSPGRFRDMNRVMGTVVSIAGDTVVVKPESGEDVTVKIASDTRIRKDREEAKLADFKPGDHVFAAGKFNPDKSLSAVIFGGGQMRAPGERGTRMGTMGQPPSSEELQKMGLGTRFIAGEVKSIDETKLNILRPDGQMQTIEVDENTSFRAGRNQSITLADIKVGDHVMGRGEMKGGTFVPQVLRVGGAPGNMMWRGPNAERPGPPSQEQPK